VLTLLGFWLKVTARIFYNFLKTSPVVVIGSLIAGAAFSYALVNKFILIKLNIKMITVIVLLSVISSLFHSCKKHQLLSVLVAKSKTNSTNKKIMSMFFLKKALVNNTLPITVFCVLVYSTSIDKKYIAIILTAVLFSIILSFFLLRVRNLTIKEKSNYITKGIKNNLLLKRSLYDYATVDFLSSVVLCTVLFLLISYEFARNSAMLSNTTSQLFFTAAIVIFSFGFIGIISSIPNINWKFDSIVFPHYFGCCVKRTMVFLLCVFGLMFAAFFIVGGIINPIRLVKYLYCIIILLASATFISFTGSSMLSKFILFAALVAATVFISSLHSWLLPFLPIPLIIIFLQAKCEYWEWYLL